MDDDYLFYCFIVLLLYCYYDYYCFKKGGRGEHFIARLTHLITSSQGARPHLHYLTTNIVTVLHIGGMGLSDDCAVQQYNYTVLYCIRLDCCCTIQ